MQPALLSFSSVFVRSHVFPSTARRRHMFESFSPHSPGVCWHFLKPWKLVLIDPCSCGPQPPHLTYHRANPRVLLPLVHSICARLCKCPLTDRYSSVGSNWEVLGRRWAAGLYTNGGTVRDNPPNLQTKGNTTPSLPQPLAKKGAGGEDTLSDASCPTNASSSSLPPMIALWHLPPKPSQCSTCPFGSNKLWGRGYSNLFEVWEGASRRGETILKRSFSHSAPLPPFP